MIRPLRRRHRLWIALLSLTLPVGVGLGLAARPEAPRGESRSSGLDWTKARELEGLDLSLLTDPSDASLWVRPSVDAQRPDVLVYLTSEPPGLDSLPRDAHLVGSLAGVRPRRLELGDARGSTLVLYSLGHQEVLGSAAFVER